MQLHPSTLIENEKYVLEVRDKSTNNIKEVYHGKRKITTLDKIDEDGVYNSLWFVDVELIYVNYVNYAPPKLKRQQHISYSDLQSQIVKQNGFEFILNDDEEVIFYDFEFYEKLLLPKLLENTADNYSTCETWSYV